MDCYSGLLPEQESATSVFLASHSRSILPFSHNSYLCVWESLVSNSCESRVYMYVHVFLSHVMFFAVSLLVKHSTCTVM